MYKRYWKSKYYIYILHIVTYYYILSFFENIGVYNVYLENKL